MTVIRLLRTLACTAVLFGAMVALDYTPAAVEAQDTDVVAQGDCQIECKTARARCERRTCRQGSERWTGTLIRRGECCFRGCPESPLHNRCWRHSYKVGCCGSRTS